MDGFDVTKLTKEEQQEIEEQQLRAAIDAEIICPTELVTEPELRKLLGGKRSGTGIDGDLKKMRMVEENGNQDLANAAAPSKGKRGGAEAEPKEKQKLESKNQDVANAAPSKSNRGGIHVEEVLKDKNYNQDVAIAAPARDQRGGADLKEEVPKKQKLESKNQDEANAAPSRAEETKKEKQEEEEEQMTPPGTPKANDGTAPAAPEVGPSPPMPLETPGKRTSELIAD